VDKKDLPVKPRLENTLSLITSTTPSLLALEVPVLEQPLVFPRQVSKLLVFLSFSQPDLTPLQLKVESTQHSETCILTTGDGIFMIPSKVAIGSEIRTPSNT